MAEYKQNTDGSLTRWDGNGTPQRFRNGAYYQDPNNPHLIHWWNGQGAMPEGVADALYVADPVTGLLTLFTGSEAGSPPVCIQLPTQVGDPTEGEYIQGSLGVWEGDPFRFEMQFFDADTMGPIDGEDDSALLCTEALVGVSTVFGVRAEGPGGLSEWAYSAPLGPIVAAVDPPSATTAPVIAGTGRVGSTLTRTAAVWANGPTSVTWVWTRDDTPIPGTENATSYTLTEDDEAADIASPETAYNSAAPTGVVSASNVIGPIEPAPIATIIFHDLFSRTINPTTGKLVDQPAAGTSIENRAGSIVSGAIRWDQGGNGTTSLTDGSIRGQFSTSTSRALIKRALTSGGETVSAVMYPTSSISGQGGTGLLLMCDSEAFTQGYYAQVSPTSGGIAVGRRKASANTVLTTIAGFTPEINTPHTLSFSWEPLTGPDRVRLRVYVDGEQVGSDIIDESVDQLRSGTGYAAVLTAVQSRCTEAWLVDQPSTPGLDLRAYPPLITSLRAFSVPEEAPFSIPLRAVLPADFEITGGTENDDFFVSEVDGLYDLEVTAYVLNYEEPYDENQDNIYTVEVTATDTNNGLQTVFDVVVTVTDVEETVTQNIYYKDHFATNAPTSGADIVGRLPSDEGSDLGVAWARTSATTFAYDPLGYFRGTSASFTATGLLPIEPGADGSTVSVIAMHEANAEASAASAARVVLMVGCTSGYGSGYWAKLQPNGVVEMYRRVNGTNSATPIFVDNAANPIGYGVKAIYSFSKETLADRVRLRVYANGTQIAEYEDTAADRVTAEGFGGFQAARYGRIYDSWMSDKDTTLAGVFQPTPDPDPEVPVLPSMGVYFGGTVSDRPAFETWVGREVTSIPAHGNRGSASKSLADQWALDWRGGIDYVCRSTTYRSTGRFITFSIPIMTVGSTLAAAANGEYNSQYTWAAQKIAAAFTGQDVLYIRTGEEFNATWFPWAPHGGNEENFVKAFRHLVNCFRAVDSRFKFEWNTYVGRWTKNGVNLDPEVCYPGDDYVDVIGMDVYWNPRHTIQGMEVGYDDPDPATAFAWLRTRNGRGMDWLVAFAAAHNKPIAISEWGLECDKIQNQDITPYFQGFADYFVDENVIYTAYWNVNSGGANGDLTETFPQFQDEFRTAFNPLAA